MSLLFLRANSCFFIVFSTKGKVRSTILVWRRNVVIFEVFWEWLWAEKSIFLNCLSGSNRFARDFLDKMAWFWQVEIIEIAFFCVKSEFLRFLKPTCSLNARCAGYRIIKIIFFCTKFAEIFFHFQTHCKILLLRIVSTGGAWFFLNMLALFLIFRFDFICAIKPVPRKLDPKLPISVPEIESLLFPCLPAPCDGIPSWFMFESCWFCILFAFPCILARTIGLPEDLSW